MLTTNDVRVLRLLVERGPHTPNEVERAFRLTRAGGEVARRRLLSLARRGLLTPVVKPFRPGGIPATLREIQLDVTGEGARQLRRADEAAYGSWA